jgi:hypothetical protein
MKTILPVLVLLGIASAANRKSRIQHLRQNLAETFTGTVHNCLYSISRVNAGPANYSAIISAGSPYTDASFPATTEMIHWNDYPGSDNLQAYASACTY